jgi:hypothetical protein
MRGNCSLGFNVRDDIRDRDYQSCDAYYAGASNYNASRSPKGKASSTVHWDHKATTGLRNRSGTMWSMEADTKTGSKSCHNVCGMTSVAEVFGTG